MGCSKEMLCYDCKTHWWIAYGSYGWIEPTKWFTDNHPADHKVEELIDDGYHHDKKRDALIDDHVLVARDWGADGGRSDILVEKYSEWKFVNCQDECPPELSIEEWFKQQWNTLTNGVSDPVSPSATGSAAAS